MERAELHNGSDQFPEIKIERLPKRARVISWLGSHWPFLRGRGRLSALMESSLRDITGTIPITLHTAKGPISILAPCPDHSASLLATFGAQDTNLQRTILELIQGSKASAPKFIDIGANLGVYSLVSAYCSKVEVTAFEPQLKLCQLLETNSKHLKLEDKICVRNIALSDKAGVAGLITNSYDVGQAQINTYTRTEKIVNVSTLDLEISKLSSEQIALIKIDVEGHEYNVLNGATELLTFRKIPIILELNFLEHLQSSLNSFELLKQLGYEEFYVIDSEIYPISNGTLPICNVLALESLSQIGGKLNISRSFRPRSTKTWPLSEICK